MRRAARKHGKKAASSNSTPAKTSGRRTSRPVPITKSLHMLVSDVLAEKLRRFAIAKRFLDQCIREGEASVQNGSRRDARNEYEKASDELLEAIPKELKDSYDSSF